MPLEPDLRKQFRNGQLSGDQPDIGFISSQLMPCQQDSIKSKIGKPQDGQYNDILLLDLFLHRLTILLLFPLVSSFHRLLTHNVYGITI